MSFFIYDKHKINMRKFLFQGFGKADHTIAVGLLKKKYPDYEITWSDEGY